MLELVWSSLLRLYEREAAVARLMGVNPLLGDRRPIDLIRTGRTADLMRAIRAERSDTFAWILYRCFTRRHPPRIRGSQMDVAVTSP